MKLIAASLLCACAAQAQLIQIWPSNYVHTLTTENNLGQFWPRWVADTEERAELGARTLTWTYTVFYDVPWNGSKLGAPRQLEERWVYAQLGAMAYKAVRGERITYFAPAKSGGWIAQTNAMSVEGLPWLQWSPGMSGEVITRFGLIRTVSRGSSLDLWCRNQATSLHYLLTVKCWAGGQPFNQQWRFEPAQVRVVTIGTEGDLISYNLEEASDSPLPW